MCINQLMCKRLCNNYLCTCSVVRGDNGAGCWQLTFRSLILPSVKGSCPPQTMPPFWGVTCIQWLLHEVQRPTLCFFWDICRHPTSRSPPCNHLTLTLQLQNKSPLALLNPSVFHKCRFHGPSPNNLLYVNISASESIS